MKDWKLDLCQIFHGGIFMGLLLFFLSDSLDQTFLFPFLASGVLYFVSSRKKSVVLYLGTAVLVPLLLFLVGTENVERFTLLAGGILGGFGYFSGRKERKPGFFGGPSYAFLFPAPIAYVLGVTQKLDSWKERACLFAAVYVLLCLFYDNRKACLDYIEENKKLHRFPGKRLKRRNRNVMVSLSVLVLSAMILGFFLAPKELKFRQVSMTAEMEMTEMQMSDFEREGGSNFLGEPKEPPRWLKIAGEIFYYVILTGFLSFLTVLVFLAVKRILRGYREGFVEAKGLREEQEEDQVERIKVERGFLSGRFGKRTPSELIRKYYKKWIRSGKKEAPRNAATPTEVEEEANVQDERLHWLYEKARYSKEECTMEEAKFFKRKKEE